MFQQRWVDKAVALVNEQYGYRVASVLDAVTAEYSEICNSDTDSLTLSTKVELNKRRLDSLLSAYLRNSNLPQKYEYYIVNALGADSVYISPDAELEYYTAPLAHLGKNDEAGDAQLKLYFPGEKQQLFGMAWERLTVYFAIFTAAIAFSLFYLVRKILRQKRLAQEQADFIHSMIHELKTPVATIEMSSKALKKAGISITDYEKLRSYAEIIGEENNRIWMCVDSLLQMLTVNKRSLGLRKELVDINAIIKTAVEGFSVATMAQPVTFTLSLDDRATPILADKMHIRAVLDNLLDNAIKYSPRNSTICVTTELTKRNIIIIVADNGRGIAKKDQKHIFKKFYRVSSERRKGIKGFGLGLYYVKQVVEAHEGVIYVKSKLNKGTQIGVILPIE